MTQAHDHDDSSDVIRVSEMATLFTPWSLRAAVTFGLPDLIAEGVNDVDQLAARSGTDACALSRLLRHLTNLGFLYEIQPDYFELSQLGQVLRSDHPAQLVRFYDQSNPFIRAGDSVIPGLLYSVRTGVPAWERTFGRAFWDDLASNPDLAKAFDEAMSVHASQAGGKIADAYDWTTVRRLVDVGGGTGQVIAEVLRAHSHLRGTLVDLPATAARAAETFDVAKVADRVELVGQSFFDPLPAGADAYLLTHVIHNWCDMDSVKIMRRCADAAGIDGRVLLVEQVISADRVARNMISSQRDLSMLVVLGSKERSEEEFQQLGDTAGLALSSTVPLTTDGIFILEYLVKR